MPVPVVIFKDKKFHEIDDQDNPAMRGATNRCLMIVKANDARKVADGFSVLEIDDPENIHDRVTGLGVFWRFSNAEAFAKNYSETI